jgi:hypothetical protein
MVEAHKGLQQQALQLPRQVWQPPCPHPCLMLWRKHETAAAGQAAARQVKKQRKAQQIMCTAINTTRAQYIVLHCPTAGNSPDKQHAQAGIGGQDLLLDCSSLGIACTHRPTK